MPTILSGCQSMKLRCPQCGARLTLAAAEAAETAAALVEELTAWGRYRPIVVEYVACFRVRQGAEMSEAKRLRLLREVREMWESGRLRYNGRDYVVRPADLLWGMQQVANRELVGLKNHNYLKVVVVGRLKDREKGKGKREKPMPNPSSLFPAITGARRKVIEIPDE